MKTNDKTQKLTKALSQGSIIAFEELYDLYSDKLYYFAMSISSGNKYMAEEVVQQTFIRIWETHQKIDPEKAFVTYICIIAKNLLIDMYRRQTIEFIYADFIQENTSSHDFQTEDHVTLSFLNDFIDELAKELPTSRKKIFLLSKKQHYTNKEIAQIMNISESTVTTQLSLAVKFMKEKFNQHYDKLFLVLLLYIVNEIK